MAAGQVGAAAAVGPRRDAGMRWRMPSRWRRPVPRRHGRAARRRVEHDAAEAVAAAGGEEADGRRPRPGPGRASRSWRCRSRGWPSGRPAPRSRARGRRWSRGCGRGCMRAVTFQSMRRTSSPGWYSRVSPGSVPWPGHEAQVVAVQHAVEPTGDVELEPAQHLFGRRLRPGRGESSGGRLGHRRHRVTARCPGTGRRGAAGDRDSTRARMCSASTPSGQRLVGEHQPVAQHLGGDVEDVLGQDVVAAPQQGEGPAAGDQAEAGPRAGAVGDQPSRSGMPWSPGSRGNVAADAATDRGDPTLPDMGDDWRRRFRCVIPVRRPEVWASRELMRLLTDTLSFLSEDEYRFEFVDLHTPVSLDLYFDFRDPVGDDESADEVVLFSGGLDLLAGAVDDLLGARKRVVLVSHHSASKLAGRQRALASALEQRARDRVLHVPVRMNKRRGLTVEYSQRSRSFFFVALGAVVARIVGTNRIRLYENGIVSVNLPIAENVIGARATRSTHPSVIACINQLLASLFDGPTTVENPYALLTKAEVVKLIEARGCADLIPQTVSCSRVYQIETDRPHCGECTQCLGRRFAVLSAGVEQHDPEQGYRVRLFVDERREGTRRALAVSYIELARELGRMSSSRFPGEVRGRAFTRPRRYAGTSRGQLAAALRAPSKIRLPGNGGAGGSIWTACARACGRKAAGPLLDAARGRTG